MSGKKSFLERPGVQSVLAALLCIILGLLIGFLVLLAINPSGAGAGIMAIIKNFLNYPTAPAQMKYLGNTLVKAAPLLMCALSINFCYKTGLFNIGAAGQYVVGAGASLYVALKLGQNWFLCLLAAIVVAGLWGCIVGLLKAYCNVNEVISGIMLNWIGLYLVNMLLSTVKEPTSPYTLQVAGTNKGALLPTLGLDKLFSNNKYVTIAVPLAILVAILIWVVLNKTKFGYEVRATGFNKEAARYAGMNEKRNIILTLVVGGALAGAGAGGSRVPLPDRLRTVVRHAVLGSVHGLQRHRGYVPRGPEPDRDDLLVVLYPAHHERRQLSGQEHVSVADC